MKLKFQPVSEISRELGVLTAETKMVMLRNVRSFQKIFKSEKASLDNIYCYPKLRIWSKTQHNKEIYPSLNVSVLVPHTV